MDRKTFLRAGAATIALAAAHRAAAQAYPSRPVRVVIPFPPGGTLDTVGRMLAQKLTEQTGQNFLVENRPGGNGVIGGDAVAKAPADGYTLLFNASTFTSAPMTMKSVPYSVERDFTPIVLVAKAPLSVAIGNKVPVTDIRSLIAYAKAQDGKMTFATGSIGSAGHLATELLARTAGFRYTVIPYKGTAPALQDLVGGQIEGFIDPVLGSLAFHRNGQLKVVGVTSSTRVPNLPEAPTVAETLPGYEFTSWYGLWAPAGLPEEIRGRLNTEVNKALAGEMRERLTQQGIIVSGGSVADFVSFQRDDMARSLKLITEGNIRLE
jgi:tripartite-type tricarboxylate transporter receptor subunit TctC